jgi:hypothetical protein
MLVVADRSGMCRILVIRVGMDNVCAVRKAVNMVVDRRIDE